jgi:hypothetical protein
VQSNVNSTTRERDNQQKPLSNVELLLNLFFWNVYIQAILLFVSMFTDLDLQSVAREINLQVQDLKTRDSECRNYGQYHSNVLLTNWGILTDFQPKYVERIVDREPKALYVCADASARVARTSYLKRQSSTTQTRDKVKEAVGNDYAHWHVHRNGKKENSVVNEAEK